MKLARMFAALPLLTGLAWPQQPAPVTGTAPKVAAKAAKPKKAPKVSRADSLRNAPLKAKLDSLVRQDSLRRSDSLHVADSLARLQALWREDSLRKVDSLRRSDSLERIGRTWYVTRVHDITGSNALSASLQEGLRQRLLRRGGVILGDTAGRDTADSFDSSWRVGLASGSGRLLYTSLQRTADSAWNLAGWVFETSSGTKLDSTAISMKDTSAASRDAWVGELVRRLHPTPEQAQCFADSLVQARTLWAIEIPVNHLDDTTLTSRLRFGFRDAFAMSGRGRGLFLKDSVYCPNRGCLDTMASRLGAHRVLQSDLSRAADSSWHLVVVASNAASDSLIDSFLVTSPKFDGLVAKAVSLLLPAPAACRPLCQRSQSDQEHLVWSLDSVLSDSARVSSAANLSRELARALAADLRHQFVPRELAARKSHPRATPAGQWIDRRIETRLEGSDSLWTFRAILRDARSGFVLDTLRLTRGGYTPRVFAWFGRKLSDALHPRPAACANPCRVDSARAADSLSRASDSGAALRTAPLASALPACDTCVSQDTLEAGLALIEPQWKDVTDTLQTLFVDSLRGALSRDGHYQVLPMSLTDPIYPSSGVACDSVCRQALRCRTGASTMVTSSLSRDGSSWRVKAQLIDLRTGKVLSQMSSLEHRNDVQRLREIAPWVGRKLTGNDSAAVAPSSRRSLGIPWGKVIALVLPVTVGLISVVSRW